MKTSMRMTEKVSRTIEVGLDVRSELARSAHLFRETMSSSGTLVVRLMSSPGAGKTSLLERTAEALAEKYRVGVLVGDIETQRDAIRLSRFAPSFQITTGGACHLEMPLVENGLKKLNAGTLDFLFVEDIGNLICPASHDLGEHLRVVLLSTTEGDDKPGKYPKAFRRSQVVVISKIDLLPYVPFDVEAAQDDARRVQSDLRFFHLSALQTTGVDAWIAYLLDERERLLQPVRAEARRSDA